MKTKTKSAAIVTIFNAPKMSKKGRESVAAWLTRQAGFLRSNAKQLTHGRFTARYLYGPILVLATSCTLLAQTNTNSTPIGAIRGFFDLGDTNSLINAKEVSVVPILKFDGELDRVGGGIKLDWFITDQQGMSVSLTEFGGDNTYWQTAYKARTVFGKLEVGLETGTFQRQADTFGDVLLYTAPSLTYRFTKTNAPVDVRATVGVDLIATRDPSPWLGVVFRFVR